MQISSLCTKDVITVNSRATLREAARLMSSKHVGSLIVTDSFSQKRTPIGIITDRDIALCVGNSLRPQDMPITQVMQTNPITLVSSTQVTEAIHVMRKEGLKRILVVDDDGALFGILSIDDVLKGLGEEIIELSQISEAQVLKEMTTLTSNGGTIYL